MQDQQPVPVAPSGITISWRTLALSAGAFVLAVAVAVVLWQFVFVGSKRSTTARTPKISFRYPPGWKFAPHATWAALGAPADASAVLERTGDSAVAVVLRGNATDLSTKAAATAAANRLNGQLAKEYSDYAFLKAQTLRLPHAGKALIFSYVRTKQQLLHTITFIPAGRISYIVETASPPKNKEIGTEISAILRSATLR